MKNRFKIHENMSFIIEKLVLQDRNHKKLKKDLAHTNRNIGKNVRVRKN